MDWIASISDWLGALAADPERLRLGYSALLGAAVFILAFALYFVIADSSDPVRNRVHSVKEAGEPPARKNRTKSALEALGNLFMPKAESSPSRNETLLRHAGFRSGSAVRIFYGIKLAAMIFIPLLLLAVVAITHVLPLGTALNYTLLAALPCFLVPDIVLKWLARRYQDRLRRGLPDAMDLLVVCSEAGLGLSAGIQRVAGELELTHPELADELGLFSMQTRAGMDNRAALKDLEQRTGLDDIQVLVAMLLQSMRFGTSIADTLRIYSEELRDKRLQRAQEKAARVSTLLLFPLVLCILPSFFLVVLGPVILGIIALF